MIVDIRKFSLDIYINEFILNSVIKKNWFGRKTDNYWKFLKNTTKEIETNFNAHLFSDLLIYLIDEKKITLGLDEFAAKIAANRSSAVFLIALDDKEKLLFEIYNPDFTSNFLYFCEELNENSKIYTRAEINYTVSNFELIIHEMNEENGLLINIG